MQQIKNLININQSTSTQIPISKAPRGTKQDREFVAELFVQLKAICTGWQQAMKPNIVQGTKAYKRRLLDAFSAAGRFEFVDVESALREIEREESDFLPNPGRLVRYAREQRKIRKQQEQLTRPRLLFKRTEKQRQNGMKHLKACKEQLKASR